MSRRNQLILLLASAFSYACYLRGERNPYARYVAEGLRSIEEGALQSVASHELFDGAMRGMVGVLRKLGDAHSQFLDEAQANPLRSDIHQQFGGIGVRLGFVGEEHRLTIVAPPDPETPAARAKLQMGDSIVAIDDHPTAGMSMDTARRLLRGEPGTNVRLTIGRATDARPRSVELVRDVITTESVLGDRRDKNGAWQFRLETDPRIAHIRITSFGDRTAFEFAGIMRNVVAAGARAIVLDVRDNPGGSLDAAVAVCQMLLPAEKMIVETRGRGLVVLRRYVSDSDGPYAELPVAVVVNHQTASAGEIVAACLQDHGRAVILGERTYGKGTVQQLLPLQSGKSLLELTWASFWRPSGGNIHHPTGEPDEGMWGVKPDSGFEQKLSPEDFETYLVYRELRDGFGPTGEKCEVDLDAAPNAAGFVDRPLQMAEEYLRRKLDGVHNGPL